MVESWDDPPSGVKNPYAGSPKLHFELVTGPTCKGMHCNISKKVSEVHLGVSLNGGIPKTPKMIIFSRKTYGCWVPPF